MRIKRFFAPDTRRAIQMVRDELGPDAVILSNKRVDGGVEIISAIDYDESLLSKKTKESSPVAIKSTKSSPVATPNKSSGKDVSEETETYQKQALERKYRQEASNNPSSQFTWSQEPTIKRMQDEITSMRLLLENQVSQLAWREAHENHPYRAELIKKLIQLGIAPSLYKQVTKQLRPDHDIDALWQHATSYLCKHMPIYGDDFLNERGVVALVGPTGVGKTTTIAKIAARYSMRHKTRKVALVTVDNYRIGAHEQLKAYGRILDMPVRVAADKESLQDVLDDLYDMDLVLIDTTGMSQNDKRVKEQHNIFDGSEEFIRTFLVLSATTSITSLRETVSAFRSKNTHGCIFTKIDEAAELGAAITVSIEEQLAVPIFSDGQRVPEDMHLFSSDDFVGRGISKMNNDELIEDDEIVHGYSKIGSRAYV